MPAVQRHIAPTLRSFLARLRWKDYHYTRVDRDSDEMAQERETLAVQYVTPSPSHYVSLQQTLFIILLSMRQAD